MHDLLIFRDSVVSFTLGRPTAIKDEDINVSLPSHLDDSQFGPEKPLVPDQCGGSALSPFIHLIRIRRLSGEILSALYVAKQNINLSLDEKRKLRQNFHMQVNAWRDASERLNLTSVPEQHDGSYVSCFLTPDWYTAVYNNAILLLYRPSPMFPHPTNSLAQNSEEQNLLYLFNAAKNTINAYAELHRQRRFNYSWITLHGVFIAGLAYVYCVGRALKYPTPSFPIPDYLEIINDTRTCSNMLVAICERWNVVRRSCELFNKLSTAVIRDAVNAATRQHISRPVENMSVTRPRENMQAASTFRQGGMLSPADTRNGFNDINMAMDHIPMADHFFIADEFRQFSETFDTVGPGDQAFQSELIMGFSQDWSFDDSLFGGQHI